MTKETLPKKELTPKEIQEIELFRQIQEDERNENEKKLRPDTRTLDEKIKAWDDGGCSTGFNDDE